MGSQDLLFEGDHTFSAPHSPFWKWYKLSSRREILFTIKTQIFKNEFSFNFKITIYINISRPETLTSEPRGIISFIYQEQLMGLPRLIIPSNTHKE